MPKDMGLAKASSNSGLGKAGAIIGAAIVIIVIVAGFAVSFPVNQALVLPTSSVLSSQVVKTVTSSVSTSLVDSTYVSSSASSYQTNSSGVTTITEQTTSRQLVLVLVPETLQAGFAQPVSSPIPAFASVTVNWTTDNPVTVYLFNSSEYSAFYKSSGAVTSPNLGGKTNTGNGSLTFTTPAVDTYYLVLFNPNVGTSGGGAQNDEVSSSGIATYNTVTTTRVAENSTYFTTTTIYSTLTSTSTSTIAKTATITTMQYSNESTELTTTTSCRLSLWQLIIGSKCP